MFDTKVALIVRDDLAAWQKLNVVAFLATGVAAEAPEALGEPYEDAANPDLVGLALHGPKKAVDKAVKGLALHA
ncbi:DUF2000 family protein [Burkholderia anthina]|uniref:DUF2000 family protein n=1 Tax=Burkholderia anthina TaxID=179879 RepID=UPI0037BE5747